MLRSFAAIYRLVYKVGIIGPESTGKSTLAQYLAKRYKGVYIPEYAREYVERKGTTEVSFDEVCEIARHQISLMQRLEVSGLGVSGLEVSGLEVSGLGVSGLEVSGLEVSRLEVSGLGVSGLEVSGLEDVCFFDTELIVTKVWFDYVFDRVPQWLEEAIRRYPMNVYLLTYPDIEWHQDGTRSNGSDEKRMELFKRYEAEIQALDIPYYIIRHN